jgi:hypothetical protein
VAAARSLAVLLGVCVLVGCDVPEEVVADACPDDTVLTYENFGEPYLLTWCVSCHSSWVAEADRQDAPDGVDFDTYGGFAPYADTAAHLSMIQEMPPAGGPTADDRARFTEWVACGSSK